MQKMAKRNNWGAIRRLPSKRFQASYIGQDGIRYTGPDTFKTRTEASAYLAETRTEMAKGQWQTPRGTINKAALEMREDNFGEYALRHILLQTNRSGELLRASTQALYRRLLANNLKPFLELSVQSIKRNDVQQWYANSIASGKKTTVSKAYKLLSAVLRRAKDEGLIPSNPCQIRGAHSAVTGKMVAAPTAEEVAKIAEAINSKFKVLTLLAAYGGFRFSEITELRRKDVQALEADGVVYYSFSVSRGVTQVSGKFVVAKPKSVMSTRVVPVTSALTPIISDFLLNEVAREPESLLFPASNGQHLPHYVYIKAFNCAKKAAGVTRKGITPHSLRHFGGTYLHLAGATLPELMTWLGDSSIAAVQRYLHVTNRTPGIVSRMEISPNFNGESLQTFDESLKV